MNDIFIKFPKTHYLVQMGSKLPRDDKILPFAEAQIFFNNSVSIEEKVDGSNLGFSLSENGSILAQHRGNYINENSHPQYKKLNIWIKEHYHSLLNILANDYILFGEWCYARHSIQYEHLPDWFLGFDIYDQKNGKFFSRKKRSSILKNVGIEEVPFICEKLVTKEDICNLVNQKSSLYNGPVEGIYLRLDGNDGFLKSRAKVVRAEFSQVIDKHWSKANLIVNGLVKDNSSK